MYSVTLKKHHKDIKCVELLNVKDQNRSNIFFLFKMHFTPVFKACNRHNVTSIQMCKLDLTWLINHSLKNEI